MSRSWGRVVFGALLLVVGIGWLLQTSGLIDFPLSALTAVALIVVGVGLVAGARRGSHGGLIVLGAVIALALVLGTTSSSSWAVSVDRGFGLNDRVHRPATPDELRPYRAGAGQLTIDLTRLQLELDGDTSNIDGRVGAGRIVVVVPRQVPLRVDARTGVGNIRIFGERRTSGISARDVYESGDYALGRPRISLRLRAGVGSINVVRGRQRVPLRIPELQRDPLPFPVPQDQPRISDFFNDETRSG